MRPYEMGSCSLATPCLSSYALAKPAPQRAQDALCAHGFCAFNMAFPPRTAIASSLLGRANSLSAQVLARHHPFWEALAISPSLEAFLCSLLMLHAHSYCDKSMFFWDLCSGWSLSLDHMLFQVRSLLPLNAQGTSRLHTQCLTLCVQVPIEWSYS